jgi:hypothetical protein
MSDWGDIVASGERFPTVGKRHGLRLITNLARSDGDRAPRLTIEVHDEDLDMVLQHVVPVGDGAPWVDALMSVLDVPTDELPPAESWASITDQVLAHRRDLEDLPVLDDPRG